VLERDLFIPYVQIAIGLALILGFFTVIATVVAGFLIVSGPILQLLAILSNSDPTRITNLEIQGMMVTTGPIDLLLLVVAVLWLTPTEGTPWSLDAMIFARRRTSPGTAPVVPAAVETPAPPPSQAQAPAPEAREAKLSANHEE
jgi:hypothetical protein